MIRPWERIGSRACGDYRVFSVREDRSRSPRTGQVHPFYVLESADWVNCLAITKDQQLVCIQQYRHGTQSVALEIPGGLVDEGERPEVAALRELQEETGFVADSVVHVGSMHPNPAILNNVCHFYAAFDATLSSAQRLDSGEDIDVVLIDVSDIRKVVTAGDITHGISLAGLYYMDLYLRGKNAG